MSIKLIVGLKNPGSTYALTRHNAGAWFTECLVQHYHAVFKVHKKLQTELSEIVIDGETCKLAQPLTYMNHSGFAVRALSQFYRYDPHELLIAHDDLDLVPGRIKLKTGGGHGGHNGLKHIISQLGSSNFHRIRIGIGHPGHKDQVLKYVLGHPPQTERQLILEALDGVIDEMPRVVTGDMAFAMNVLNG